jgi:hypothetical protein
MQSEREGEEEIAWGEMVEGMGKEARQRQKKVTRRE